MLLLFLLFSLASAHVPAFDSTSEAYDISDKSWGIYRELKEGESFSVFLDVPKGENISFSVNLAGSQDENFDSSETYIEVTLFGHNATQIHCDPKFTGWGYEDHTASRRLDGDSDRSLDIPQKYGKLHFEPFGVGYYRALAACQGEVPVADSYFNVTVKALKVIPQDDVLRISIGAGMAEQFDIIQDILYLPVTITRTWFWDQYLGLFIMSQLIGAAGIVILMFNTLPSKDTEEEDIDERDKYKYKWAKYFMIGVLLHNIVVYVIRLLAIGGWIGYVKHAEDSDFDDLESMNMWIAMIIHIIIPAVFLLLVANFDLAYKEDGLTCAAFYVFHILFILYCAFFLIQTFWLGAVASIALFVTRICMPPKGYRIVPQTAQQIIVTATPLEDGLPMSIGEPVLRKTVPVSPIIKKKRQFRFIYGV